MKKLPHRLLFLLLLLSMLAPRVLAAKLLIPGGQVIGISLENDTVTVASIDETLGANAKAAGLRPGDRLLQVGDTKIHCPQDVRSALEHSDGEVRLSVLRGGKEKQLRLRPAITQQGPKLGVLLKQGVTGIGTVTYYDPELRCFGALGHGVNDSDGALVTMHGGAVYRATVISVKQGKTGKPGQLMGALSQVTPLGELNKNAPQGIFGAAPALCAEDPLPIATAEDIRTGPATIRSTVKGEDVQEYSVEIMKIYPQSRPAGRNMLLRVTDEDLLNATGGIVQGMSGSPLVQDGKLIGAVTHVLVNDPTMGYGIFIENMLEAAG